jgi:hypothetical protein
VEGILKVSKLLIATSLFFVALLFALTPAVNVVAQTGATNTPAIVIVTATPSGSTDSGAGTASTGASAAATVSATDDPNVPYDKKLIRTALAALSKKLNRKITIVKGYEYELQAFPDSGLGCAPQGEVVVKGDAWGYQVIIRPFDGKTYEIRVIPDLSRAFFCGEGAAAPASGVAVVTGKAVGGNFEIGAHIYGFGTGTVSKLKSAKMLWIKKQIPPSDGNAINDIAAAHAAGFKILFGVKGGAGEVLNPGFFDQYAAYVGKLAAAGADAIEIWNEPNIQNEWPKGQIDPAKYTELLKKSYAAIKAARPETMVISAALAPTGFFSASGGKGETGWDDNVYYAGMAAAGAAAAMDCVGIHYNEGIVPPGQGSGDPRDNYPTRYFGAMLSRAMAPFPGMKGCFTELGYLTPEGYGNLPGGFAWAQKTTIAQQAQWLAEAAVIAANSGQVRLMIVWNMDFPPSSNGVDPQAGYAMIRADGSCPACEKIASVMP